MRILVVEDDERLADIIRRAFFEQGHVVDVAADGLDGERCFAGGYDVAIVDVNLPRRDGLQVIRNVRAAGDVTPVLVLTSRDTVEDVIAGLDAGADDYLRKPFAFGELEARVRALARRRIRSLEDEVLAVADVRFDVRARRAMRGGREIPLTARETAFLEYFMRNAGATLTRTMIEDALFDRRSEVVSNVIDVYVRRLRAKLCAGGEPQILHTVRGVGYRFGPR
jgi:DNA-binding response OmpR family regulator